ncbi:tektin-4 [Lepisosteus oculatus]|uniref:tektin-4 n=1 Tax=Lepisosteus oculatus TaxID=7918 RepID=UPI0035F528D2
MSAQVLASRPKFDTRRVAQEPLAPGTPEAAVNEGMLTSAGEATAGYRSAKYTPDEWHHNNQSAFHQAAADRDRSERLRQETRQLCSRTQAATLAAQAEATRQLGERLQDTHFWRSELQRQAEALAADTELLQAQRRRLERALDAADIPYAIATDNLACRGRRLGSDLVRDAVEVELLREVELIRNVQELLKRTLDQAINQIRSNRDVKQTLELDWSDKYEAYNMDDQCGRYNNLSADIQYHFNSAKLQDNVSTHETWTKFTQDNLVLAEREEQASVSLRALIDRVLQDTAEDLRAQCTVVDRAFSQRCEEMNEAKVRLEQHLNQILEQIGGQEKNIVTLQQAIRDKEAPMKVAQSRLYQRSFRPNMELCRDSSQLRLVSEVGQITDSIEALKQKLELSRESLRNLEDTRMALEKEIACKANSLFIDRDKCMTHRTRYPTVIRLTGY